MRPEIRMEMNEIVAAWRRGRRYYLKRASNLVGEHDAEDVLSNAVVKMLEKGDEVRHTSAFLGCGVGYEGLTQRGKKAIRATREIPAIEDYLEHEEGFLDLFDPERLTIASELFAAAMAAISELDDDHRMAIEYAIEGVPYRVIAKKLGFSTGKAHGIVREVRAEILSRLGFGSSTEVFR